MLAMLKEQCLLVLLLVILNLKEQNPPDQKNVLLQLEQKTALPQLQKLIKHAFLFFEGFAKQHHQTLLFSKHAFAT